MQRKILPKIKPIQIEEISFSYSEKKVLDKISMEIKPGTFTVVMGPNGSGKSTLLKCSNQLLKTYKGSVSMDGIDLKKLKEHEVSKYIGYVPQNYQMLFSMTVFESLLLGLEKRSKISYSKSDLNKVSQLMEDLELTEMANDNVNNLSGGQQQRVTIARALVKNPPFLFMDEPTSGLDIKTQRDVMFFLKKLTKEKNIGILTIIHDINFAAEIADKIIVLKDGNMIAKGSPQEVVVPEIIEKTFGIKNKIIMHKNNPHMLII